MASMRLVCRLLLLGAALCFLHPQVEAGPCSKSVITIQVTGTKQMAKRLLYKPTQTVKLVLQNNVWLASSLKLSGGYSCTIITSTTSKPRTIGYAKYGAFPLVQIVNASNILITHVRITTGNSKAMCGATQLGKDVGSGSPVPCPAVLVNRAWGIGLSHLVISGRVDLFRVAQSTVQACSFRLAPANIAGVRIGVSGDGPNLIKSQIVVQNNHFRGGMEGVQLIMGAVGVTVKNNDFRNHFFTAVQCGAGTSNVGDCMLNSIVQNYVEYEPGYTPLVDASGFYFDTHWVNPGNYLSCNYVIRGRHCIYLDYTTSGVTVDGAVCAHNLDGIKTNAGHNNHVTSVITVNQTECAGWFSCQNYDVNNCLLYPGKTWDNKRKQLYSSPKFQQTYPWLSNFCQQTSARGVPCNAKTGAQASATGGCSGIPTNNVIQLSIVDSRRKAPWHEPGYRHCEDIPNASKLNQLSYKYYFTAESSLPLKLVSPPWDNVGFINRDQNDFGLTGYSVLRQQNPYFKSCPRASSGAQPVDPVAAYKIFNIWKTVPLTL